MNHTSSLLTLTLFLSAAINACNCEASPPQSESLQNKTQNKVQWKKGLSDKALAMQRGFSEITFMADRSAKKWKGWHDDRKQFGLTAFRYQLAFAGYGCTAAAAETPAYRELIEKQLHDLCERIIDVRTWPYITSYWKFGDLPPDPCRYENVMYTGHLTHLMCLYEHMIGDHRYSEKGWDFTWKDGRKTDYTLKKAIERMHVQSVANPSGGICCEPSMIFAVCNSHSSISYLLHDLLHDTEYAKINQKWFDWMSRRFRNSTGLDRSFLYTLYQTDLGLFAPFGDVGSDSWALGWGHPWFPDTKFSKTGWKYIRYVAAWKEQTDKKSGKKKCKCHAKSNPATQCCGLSSTIVSNSFIPLIAVQMEGKESQSAKKIIQWLDDECGEKVDLDGDSYAESFHYKAPPGYAAPVTGNILAALTTDGDAMRHFYRTSRQKLRTEPTLAHVDYPNLYVRAAEYRDGTLRFVILKGTPTFSGQTELICTNIPNNSNNSKTIKIYRNGKPFHDFRHENGKLILTTTIKGETVFEVVTSLK